MERGVDIKGYASERDAAAAAFESGAALLAKYLSQLDTPTSHKQLADWLETIEERVLTALEQEIPGSAARFAQWKAEHRVTIVEAQRDEHGRILRTISRPASAVEAAESAMG